MSSTQPVRQLNAEVARKIAAGEVIDRPNAIVRELMDNAVDSGADKITVEITEGGIEKVRVTDNGCGMTKADLLSCARPHATSKIESETDLLNLTTLGFRGEALSSIAAVCRLSIISGGNKMRASVTEDHLIEPYAQTDGAIVMAEGLFENFPARRLFLKRAASEAGLCKTTFIEKALPCPQKAFRFIVDGAIKLDFPANMSLTERVVQALGCPESPSLFYEVTGAAAEGTWSFKIIIGEPGVHRKNKKDIRIYVNGRQIFEYSLVQAIEYGGQGYFPNGTFPAAAAFIQINPSLVDFNIHPAKKEARFKDIADLHHGISSGLRKFFAAYTKKTMLGAIKDSDANRLRLDALIAQSRPDFKQTGAARAHGALNNSSHPFQQRPLYAGRERSAPVFYAGDGSGASYGAAEAEQRTDRIRRMTEKAISAYNGLKQNPEDCRAEMPQQNERDFYRCREDEAASQTEPPLFSAQERTAASADIQPQTQNAPAPPPLPTFFNLQNSAYAAFAGAKVKNASSEWANAPFHFLGSALGTFLIAEKGNTLYIIDKHAAHERQLFDKIIGEQGQKQALLIPYVLKTQTEDEDAYIKSIQDELCRIGFDCTQKAAGEWEFTAVQERWKGSEDDFAHTLLEKRVEPKDVIYTLAASAACKAAVKDGWLLDDAAAAEIAERALELPDPHCPHGRPVYTTVTREQLFSLVRRTE